MKTRVFAFVTLLCCVWLTAPSALADVSGRWRVTIGSGETALVGVASLEQKGDTVSGRMGPSESDTTPVSGTVSGDKLTLKTHPKPGFAVPFDTCELTIKADRLTGSIADGRAKNPIEFVRTPAAK
jgi:hypothetical protein